MKNKIRLAKFLANCGLTSRRKAENLILKGKVSIDRKVVTKLATKVEEDVLNIFVNNKRIKSAVKEYYILNKPKGYICSLNDPYNSKTVISLIKTKKRIFPVGRLDKNSQGLLLLTNDGDLTYKLTHPKFNVLKTYLVVLDKEIKKKDILKLKKGIKLEEGIAKVDKIELKNKNEILITIHQGWKRQIRRMLEILNYKVKELTRISEGRLKLGRLKLGQYKKIKKENIIFLNS